MLSDMNGFLFVCMYAYVLALPSWDLYIYLYVSCVCVLLYKHCAFLTKY